MGRFDKYKNGKNGATENKKSSAIGEIALLKTQEQYNLQFIKATKLIKSPFNKFDEYKESKAEKYEEIKNSIKEYGILNPLKVVLNNEGMYEVLGGWNRTTMIKELINEGDTRFLEGIPCYVLTNISEIDQQIISEIDNTGEGHTEPQEVRESIARLAILYQKKNEQDGTNKSVVKQISQDTGLGERQVQRYNAINNKLIPELQSYFDSKQINIENGAKISDMSEEGQKIILALLENADSNKRISSDEIKLAKEQSQKLQEELKEKEEKERELQEKVKELERAKEEQVQELLLKLEEKEEEIQNKLNETNINEEEKQEFLAQVEELQSEKEILLNEKISAEEKLKQIEQDLKNQYEDIIEEKIERSVREKEKEIEDLKNKIADLSKVEKPTLSEKEIQQMKSEIRIKDLISQIKSLHGRLVTELKQNNQFDLEEIEVLKDLFKNI